jgi:hypothetical protein
MTAIIRPTAMVRAANPRRDTPPAKDSAMRSITATQVQQCPGAVAASAHAQGATFIGVQRWMRGLSLLVFNDETTRSTVMVNPQTQRLEKVLADERAKFSEFREASPARPQDPPLSHDDDGSEEKPAP